MPSNKNILTTLLSLLKVKHTQLYAGKLFSEHPHQHDSLGLSDMLTVYKIKNVAFKIEAKEDILQAVPPFIAQIDSGFVVVDAVNQKQIKYKGDRENINTTPEIFFQRWTGVVLMVETNINSVEPDYAANKKKENILRATKYSIWISTLTALLILCLAQKVHTQIAALVLLSINMTGIYLCYLLLLNHLQIREGYGNKICSLFKQRNCNTLLKSAASSLFGIISWS